MKSKKKKTKKNTPEQSKQSLEGETKLEASHFLFQTILQSYRKSKQYVTDIKTNGIERECRNKPSHVCQSTYNKLAKFTQWGQDKLFNKRCWESSTSICRQIKQDPWGAPYIKINSKWIKNLNVTPQTIKLLKKTQGKSFRTLNLSMTS